MRRAGARRAAGARSRYRPDPWRAAGVGGRGCGVGRRAVVLVAGHRLRPGRPEPELLPAAPGRRCRSLPGAGDPGRRARRRSPPRRRRAARPTARRAAERRSRRPSSRRRCRRDRASSASAITYDGAAAPGAARRRPERRRGRAVPGRRADRRRQVHPAGRRQRPGPPLHRRHPARPGHRSTGATPATTRRASSPTWSAWSGQDPLAGFVTDTVEEELAYGMEQLGAAPGRRCASGSRRRSTCSASPSCGDAAAARAVRRPAAAGRDRRGADRAPARAGARRADLGAGPDRRRGGARRDHPAGARPRRHGAAGRAPARARRCSTPTGSSCLPGDGTGRRTATRRADAARQPTSRPPVVELGRLAGWYAAAAVGPRRPPARRSAARPAGRAVPAAPRTASAADRAQRRCEHAGSWSATADGRRPRGRPRPARRRGRPR